MLQEFFADRAETPVRARNYKIHPQGVQTDFGLETRDSNFIAAYKDSTTSLSLYSESQLAPVSLWYQLISACS